MKPVTLLLTLLAASPLPGADVPAEPAPAPAQTAGKLSPEVTKQLTDALPKYTPAPPAPAAPKPGTPAASAVANTDPEVVELPKVTVLPKKRPRLGPEVMLTNKAFNEQLAKEKLTSLDRGLNRFTLPLFGTSAEARAREEYEREKRAELAADVAAIARATEQLDPAEAKALREAAAKP
ncbi:MAG: hypothetical protein JNG83_14835 [Opitutaceae bacterium]|nr:hypothetical protein [Opitutaceae bacterium]